MKKFYAVEMKFSNVEDIWSFDKKKDRDEWVNRGEKRKALEKNQLMKRLTLNRRIVRLNKKCDSGWVNGLPETLDEVRHYEVIR